MCYLVTIGTRESHADVKTLLGRYRAIVLRPSRNSSLRSAFPPEDHLFEVTSGQCSCDLITAVTRPSLDDERARVEARYARQGWSQASIARALADWDAAHDRRVKRQAARQRQFHQVLRELATRPGGLRLVLHDYSAGFDTENVRVDGTVVIPASRLGGAAGLSPDTLVEIVASEG